ncbi:MAG: DNA polymerase III subunit gamma/tau, partial [Acidimicrobiales bacterium]
MADEPGVPENPGPQRSGDDRATSSAPAPYQALYRRYRPQRFADVLGQDHVTRALRGAVEEGRVAHAYLFSGPRGTGKTSTARILAMALNCDHLEAGEPDGTCASCVSIRQGSSLDVQELDAATNRGIEEMKDLLSRVSLGSPGRSKVYIVDEVHQLSPHAASALLKTLEDPPAHVVFVLATTDPQKVLDTIRSRTQHFEFRLLGADVLGRLLSDVADKASLGLPPEVIDLVVRRGHGSARDALSVLDQVAAAGGVDDEAAAVADLVEAIGEHDPGRILVEVAGAVSAGRAPRRIATEVLEYLRNGFLATQAPSLVMLAGDAVADVEAQARRIGPAALVRAMEAVGQALIDMRDSADPRITLEVALVRLAAPETDDSRPALLERVERLERALFSERQSVTGRAPPASSPRPAEPPGPSFPRTGGGAGPQFAPPAAEGRGPSAARAALGAHRPPRTLAGADQADAPPPDAPAPAAPAATPAAPAATPAAPAA